MLILFFAMSVSAADITKKESAFSSRIQGETYVKIQHDDLTHALSAFHSKWENHQEIVLCRVPEHLVEQERQILEAAFHRHHNVELVQEAYAKDKDIIEASYLTDQRNSDGTHMASSGPMYRTLAPGVEEILERFKSRAICR